jgi:uncharacterized coiled-coil DUF342 family protein
MLKGAKMSGSNDPAKAGFSNEDAKFLQDFMLPVNFEELTREKLTLGLIKKHSERIASMKTELELSQKKAQELKPKVEETRVKRDELNKLVHDLKEERDTILKEIRNQKRTFFNMIDQIENMPSEKDQMARHKKQLSELDWKLQTEGITIDDERRIMAEIKGVLDKVNSISRKEQEKMGMEKGVEDTTKKVADLFSKMNSAHERMLTTVNSADKIHAEYVTLFEDYSNCLKNLRWLPHRIELSQETLKYWMERLQGKHEPKKLSPEEAQKLAAAQASSPPAKTEVE